MEMNNANTVSYPAGDEDNKENDPYLLVVSPRAGRRNRLQQPVPSVGYQLGRRTRLTKKDLDFTIYEDETADEIPQPRREYYGSNLPALPDIPNGQTFNYALTHVMSRNFNELMNEAFREDDAGMMEELIANKIHHDNMSMLERVTGLYHWTSECDPLDVWLWVQDKGYHRRWNKDQREGFKEFLMWMAPLVREAGDCVGNLVMMAIDACNAALIMERFKGLGLQNLTIEKAGLSVLFTPEGEDRHVIYRRDFTMEEELLVNMLWPEYWGSE